MSGTWRAGALLLALLGPGLLLAYWRIEPRAPRLAVEDGVIPPALGAYVLAAETELEPDVLEMIRPDHYALRVYGQPDSSGHVLLYAAFYAGRGGKDAHHPEVCYPAQGWEVVEREQARVALPGGDELTAQLLRAYQGGREELVLYWFQPAHRWPRAAWLESFLRFFDNMRGAPQYAFVRLSTPIAGPREGRDELATLARHLAPHVRAALEL